MDDEDKGFFILVLGVLAAVLTVVSWWAIQDDGYASRAATPAGATADADHDADGNDDGDQGDDGGDDEEAAEAEPEPTAEPEPEPTAAPEPDPTPEPEPEPTAAPAPPAATAATVADLLGEDANLSAVAGLVAGAGLTDALAGDGPFTILAPSNAAVEGFDADAAARLFSDANAADTLTYHVIEGAYTADDLVGLLRGARSTEVATLQGDPITLSLDGDQILVNGAAVSAADAVAGNGVVHTIENVLVPREAALNLIVGLEPIQFASGSAVISDESTATLDQVVEALQTTDVAVAVEGHTDSQGDPAANQALSLERARAVVNYLVANSVDETRLSAEGFGDEQPLADNGTEEGRALNRRIEFRIDN